VMGSLQGDFPNQNHWWEFWRHDKSFVNNGLLTVRGISGIESVVDTLTANYFDATQALPLSQVLTNLGVTGTTGPALLSKAITSGAIPQLISAITPAPTQSRIGRQLTLDVTPHTLAGASSAELDVKLWAQEDSPPTLYSSGSATSSGNDALSRVARHNVFTRVRVESVKLFDVSSFSALIQRPRTKFPLVPPFVEIPILGTFAGLPLPAAKEYHRSTAIVSVVIVPTAADLAYGVEFEADRATISGGPGRVQLRRIDNPEQLRDIPFNEYHRQMMRCLAQPGEPGEPSNACQGLTFATFRPTLN